MPNLPYPYLDQSEFPTVDPRLLTALQGNLDDLALQQSTLTARSWPQTVTSLPSSPTNGQEVYYVADSTNGVVWHLKYRSASASTYKWELVGGGPLHATGAGSTTTSATYQTTAIPSTTLPLAGDYDFDFGGTVFDNAAGYAQAQFALHNNGVAVPGEVFCWSPDPGRASVGRHLRVTAITAAATLDVRYRTSGALSRQFSDIWLVARPLRVA